MKYLARSRGQVYGQQLYEDHILGSHDFMLGFIKNILPYVKHMSNVKLLTTMENTVLFHDIGKLDELNQEALNSGDKKRLPVFHEDAGAAYWLTYAEPNAVIAILIYCHHRGLPNFSDEFSKGAYAFRYTDTNNKLGVSRTTDNIASYVQKHFGAVTLRERMPIKIEPFDNTIDWRITLSLLVDSDHSDAAKHCLQHFEYKLPKDPRWTERLSQLDDKISTKAQIFSNDKEEYRNILRTEMYKNCGNSNLSDSIMQCDAPVGSGKTSAVLAYLLNQACMMKHEPRRLFIIAPFTNLICQIIDDLRDWVVLPNEDPEEIVVGHYNTADYDSPKIRHLSTLWKAKIIITTSVQFFETLAASRTSSLRKLHSLPGSMIFIDEFNSALPLKLWPLAWKWINSLATNWDCKFVLASGSSTNVWELDNSKDIIKSILPDGITSKLLELEKNRIKYKLINGPMDISDLSDIIENRGEWPKLVIMNTVQNAAVLAKYLNDEKGFNVIHLSTAFTPKHRKIIVKKIKDRLKNETNTKWILVATSCVEAGMNFSFRTGFREAFNVTSILQSGGRINRNFKYDSATLYIFTTCGSKFNKHPTADPYTVLSCLNKDLFNTETPSKLANSSMRSYWNNSVNKTEVKQLLDDDNSYNFKDVSATFKVIDADTKTVLISDSIRFRIERGYNVRWHDVQENSIQLWSNKIKKLGLCKIQDTDMFYIQEDSYDPNLLGVMKYVLGVDDFIKNGGIVI